MAWEGGSMLALPCFVAFSNRSFCGVIFQIQSSSENQIAPSGVSTTDILHPL
ncbi:MAG: hypothetical protein IPL27_22700 [Lewinellaceae bacterium]|nr:hypothetical protein [Lewinellaceae bacterium]